MQDAIENVCGAIVYGVIMLALFYVLAEALAIVYHMGQLRP